MEDKKIKAVAPPVDVESTVGAGDSSVAGFILAHSRGLDMVECVRMACAAGTATAQTPGTELCHSDDVDRLLPLVEVTVL
jgi:6-phosphofructokinase 2